MSSFDKLGLLGLLNICTWNVCSSWDFKKWRRDFIQFRASVIPTTRNAGLSKLKCSPAQSSNNMDREWGRASVTVSVPTPCGPASSLLKWPGWFNALSEHWSVMRTRGYLQLPQHSCGATTEPVAGRPYAIPVQAKHNRRCGQETVSAQPLPSSHYNKKICWLPYAEPNSQSHIFTMLGATLLPVPSTQSASINWHGLLWLTRKYKTTKGTRRAVLWEGSTHITNRNAWSIHTPLF